MSILILLLYIAAAIKYGNWANFEKWYPTLLYFIVGDLLAQFLLFDYPLWMFHPIDKIDEFFHLNHTSIALAKMAVQYTATTAIFIGRLPESRKRQAVAVIFWTGIYGANEFITHLLGGLSYHRGWGFGWDIIFNIMMLLMLIIHYKKPLLAWLLTMPIVAGLWWIFDVPFFILKS